MKERDKVIRGGLILFAGLPGWTVVSAQTNTATTSASAPDGSNGVKVDDPVWFIAGLATGLVVGAIGAKVFGRSKQND